jgi:VanZ family protein
MTASRALWSAWWAWVAFIVYGSLLPFHFTPLPLMQAWAQFQSAPFLALGVEQRADWVANGVLYLPAGWFTAWLAMRIRAPRAVSLLLALLFCLALDIGVEFAQVFFPPRSVSLNDVWAEGIGSVIGIASAPPLARWWHERGRVLGAQFDWNRLLEVYLIAYVAFCLFPYDLLLSADELRDKLRSEHWGWFIAAHDAGLLRLAFQLIAETLLAVPFGVWLAVGRAPRRVDAMEAVSFGIALGVVIELAQLFIASGTSQGASVLTRAVAVPLGATLWQRRAAWPLLARRLQSRTAVIWLGAAYLLAMVTVNGWFSARWHGWDRARGTWSELRFMPFYYHYFTTEALALFSLASVALMYAPVGLLVRLRAGTAMAAAACGALLCALVEAAKLFMQDARPDPTNVLIAGAACWVVHRGVERLTRRHVSPGAAPSVDAAAPPGGTVGRRLHVLWAVPVLYALIAVSSFPVVPLALTVLLGLCAAAVWCRPGLATAIVLATMPVLDLAPWSGRFYWDEFDWLLMVCLGTVMLRCPRRPASPPRSDGLFKLALALLVLSLAISALRALIPWPSPDDSAFYGYFSPYNALRIVKGAAWALLSVIVLRRLVERGIDIGGGIVAGMTSGLALTVIVVVWERWTFAGLLPSASDYRVTGPFSAMHKGGAYIECYLAMAVPFALAWGVQARAALAKTVAGLLVLGATYAAAITYARNGWVALLVGMIMFLGLLLRAANRSRSRGRWAGAVAAAAALLAAPILVGPFAQERIAHVHNDWDARYAHWVDALASRDDDIATAAFGMGIGRFPQTHRWRSREPQRAATFVLADEGGNRYLRLGSGSPLYIEQFVAAAHGEPYTLRLRFRSGQASAGLTVSLCEKWLLTSAACSSVQFAPNAPNVWQPAQATLELEAGSSAKAAWRPVKFSLHAPAQGAVIDVDDVQLQAPDAHELLHNGDFASRLDRWFFAVDVDPPWHIHSLPVGVLFDQGWFGVFAWTLFVGVALQRGVAHARAGNATQIAALAALTAFIASASLNTLIDAPRFLWLVMLVAALAAIDWRGARSTPRPLDRVLGDAPGPGAAVVRFRSLAPSHLGP